MNQEKIGKYIKKIRTENNLSQIEFASLFGVSSQAVSKWENGKNLPDISIIKEMSKKFNIDINNIINGDEVISSPITNNKDKYNKYIILSILIMFFLFILIFIRNYNDYNFRVISSDCKDFNLTGALVYNNKNSSININNINYCGDKDKHIYKKIECSLYENNDNVNKKIGENIIKENTDLNDFLENVDFTLDKYSSICKRDKKLFLLINATNEEDIVTSYKVNLKLSNSCLQN